MPGDVHRTFVRPKVLREPRRPWRPPPGSPRWVYLLAAGVVVTIVAGFGLRFAFGEDPPPPAKLPPPRLAEKAVHTDAPDEGAAPPQLGPGAPPPAPGPGWVRIEPGELGMGAPNGSAKGGPIRSVRVTRPFAMRAHEVTRAEWEAVMGTPPPGRFADCGPECPVESVTFYDAVAFANRLSRAHGRAECYWLLNCNGKPPGQEFACQVVEWREGPACDGYRLPTEAEWELAARGEGTDARARDAAAWHRDNSGGTPHPVGQKGASAGGVHDLLGNVAEWCWDVYEPLAPGAVADPVGPEEGVARVHRGGSWHYPPDRASPTVRGSDPPETRMADLGFRVVRTLP